MVGESNSSVTLNKVMELLYQLHLKLDFIQVSMKDNKEALQKQIKDLNAKVESGFTKLHAYMNLMSS